MSRPWSAVSSVNNTGPDSGCTSADSALAPRRRHESRHTSAAGSPSEGVEAPNVQFADFTDMLCSDGFCPAVKNGILVYRDKHHLTGTFAWLQRERVAEEIAAALAKAGVAP